MVGDDQTPDREQAAEEEDIEEVGAPEAPEESAEPADTELPEDELEPSAEEGEGPVDLAAEMYYERQEPEVERMTFDEANALPTATLKDLGRLKEERLKLALPFPLEGIGMKVMVAPCDMTTYMKMLSEVFSAADTDGVMAAAAASMKLVMSCMVEPEVENEEEMAEMLRGGGEEIMGLFAFCRQISGLENDMDGGITQAVRMAEDFSEAARSS